MTVLALADLPWLTMYRRPADPWVTAASTWARATSRTSANVHVPEGGGRKVAAGAGAEAEAVVSDAGVGVGAASEGAGPASTKPCVETHAGGGVKSV